MIALYMDEHDPKVITRGLRHRDVDVMTVQEDGHDNTPDAVILDRAGSCNVSSSRMTMIFSLRPTGGRSEESISQA